MGKAVLIAVALTGVLTACAPAPNRVASPRATLTTVEPSPTPTRTTPASVASARPGGDALTSLRGNTRNAIAYAPLSDPEDVTVEGSVPRSRAWSTSKPLVIAAYLDTVVAGHPDRIPSQERIWIEDALAKSDNAAIAELKARIPGGSGPAMTRILRSIGDTTTTAPSFYEGTMQWTVREQVRFMAALGNGQVVSPEASAFLLREMQPVREQWWGLGTIGARAFKPGWLRENSETRQMGIVGDYAVAIITAGDGPATRQGDGDYAHAWQLDRLARLVAARIGA